MKIFYVDGLDCAHCAMKIEEKLNTLPGINGAALNFATGELRIQSNLDDTQLTEQIQTILKQLEPVRFADTTARFASAWEQP